MLSIYFFENYESIKKSSKNRIKSHKILHYLPLFLEKTFF